MRKRRVILFIDDPLVKRDLMHFFDARGYDIFLCREPEICPVYGSGGVCPGTHSCGDIMIVGFSSTVIGGLAFLEQQVRNGCKLSPRNKAVIGGALAPAEQQVLSALGSAVLQKPVNSLKLEQWVAECESRIDLARPVAIRRREKRYPSDSETLTLLREDGGREEAAIVNKSICGACVRTLYSLRPNQIIMVDRDGGEMQEEALVRWSRVDGDGYLAGLSFCI